MGVLSRALADTQDAFDRVADGYDRSNSENPILCAMRARLRRTVAAFAPAGGHLLDLGCGPGSDAAAFAAHQAAGSTQADASTFGREWPIENEIGAKSEHGAGVELTIDNRNQHTGTVFGGLPQTRQKLF